MAFELTIDSAAPPARVLAAIRRDGPEWRESRLPEVLRREALTAVTVHVSGTAFQMRLAGMGYVRYRLAKPSITGTVVRLGDGCRVRARVGARGQPQPVVFVAAAAVVAFLSMMPWLAAVPLLLAGTVVVFNRWHDAALSRADPAAAFLAERLERIVAAAAEERPAEGAPRAAR